MTESQRQAAQTGRGILNNLGTGLKVLWGELKWLALSGLRTFEIRQMKHRLNQEYQTLGEMMHRRKKAPSGAKRTTVPDQDIDLAVKQIDFLKEEIGYLEEDRGRSRREYVAGRAADMDMDSSESED